jgi:hypothetical protein
MRDEHGRAEQVRTIRRNEHGASVFTCAGGVESRGAGLQGVARMQVGPFPMMPLGEERDELLSIC